LGRWLRRCTFGDYLNDDVNDDDEEYDDKEYEETHGSNYDVYEDNSPNDTGVKVNEDFNEVDGKVDYIDHCD
jgi:hypothetical protein